MLSRPKLFSIFPWLSLSKREVPILMSCNMIRISWEKHWNCSFSSRHMRCAIYAIVPPLPPPWPPLQSDGIDRWLAAPLHQQGARYFLAWACCCLPAWPSSAGVMAGHTPPPTSTNSHFTFLPFPISPSKIIEEKSWIFLTAPTWSLSLAILMSGQIQIFPIPRIPFSVN